MPTARTAKLSDDWETGDLALKNVYPSYSDTLLALCRGLDRATLAVKASNWLLCELSDDAEYFSEGDDSLADWTRIRNHVLELNLPDMARAINTMIAAETESFFEVQKNNDGTLLSMPSKIADLLEPYELPAFYYSSLKEGVAKAKAYVSDLYVILWEGDGYVIPRDYPKSFVEIWWRRHWSSSFPSKLYAMAMVENPEYGWDCYGHER